MTDAQRSGALKILEVGGTVIGVIIAASIAWQALQSEVRSNRRGVNANLEEISAMDSRVRKLESLVVEQRANYTWIRETLTDIKASVK